MSLLQSFPALELRSSCYQTDAQPLALELLEYTNKVRAIALTLFVIGVMAILGTLGFEVWQALQSDSNTTGFTRESLVKVLDHLRWNVMTINKLN